MTATVRTLEELRKAAFLTVRELAEKAEVETSTLWRIERGKHKPHISTMRRIAAAVGVHPSEVAEFAAAIGQERPQAPEGEERPL